MSLIYNKAENNHRRVIFLQSSHSDELIIASPFCFSDFSTFAADLAKTESIKKITLITTLKNDEAHRKSESLISFRDEMEKFGIEWHIRIDNSLHGKIYIFKKHGVPYSAIITSANLTNNGMRSNHEWGCIITDHTEIITLEKHILADAEYEIFTESLEYLSRRVASFPITNMPEAPEIEIGDILIGSSLPYSKKIFIKPIGTSDEPVYDGDFSEEKEQYFAKRPNAVNIGDILIAYGVGSRKLISAFEVTSGTIYTGNSNDRWKWYVKVKNLTPNMGKVWMNRNLYVMSLANSYNDAFSLPVTANGNTNLNGLKIGNDKIQLTDEFGRFLYSKIVVEDATD